MTVSHIYEVRPRKDKRGVDLISDVLSFGRLWYAPTPAALAEIVSAGFPIAPRARAGVTAEHHPLTDKPNTGHRSW
jgi:hypothetical protein